MNNLHRELAPVSEMAWAQIEEEASRTLKRYLAGRRVVDVEGPGGTTLSAVGTGHLRNIAAPADGVLARQREVKPLIELRVPFELDRQMIDDVERGANDSDWQPVKDAAKKIAFAEDAAIFDGYDAGNIEGIRQGTSNPVVTLPADVRNYPDAIAHALTELRLVGVNGPYSVVLGADAYTAVSEGRDYGYPVLQHIKRLVETEIIWAPAIAGGFVLTTRGGDFDLHLGQDFSIGYLSHTDERRAPLSAGNLHLPVPDQRSRRRPGPRIDGVGRLLALFEDVDREPVRSLRQAVVIRPQGIAAMVLGAGEVQRIRRFESETGAQPRSLQVYGLGHRQCRKLFEQFQVCALKDRVAALDRPDQAFALDQRRNAETSLGCLPDGAAYRIAPAGVTLGQVDQQAGIEIDQSHARRSASMAASISGAERRA